MTEITTSSESDSHPVLGPDTEIESILIKIQSSHHVEQNSREITRLLDRYGAVVIEFGEDESPRAQLLCFGSILGATMPHERADGDMIAEIAVSEFFKGYLGTSNAEHPFHTDGAYSDIPPRFVALRCEVAASSGGVSKLASGYGVYTHVRARDLLALESLFEDDALCVSRAGKRSCRSVFKQSGRRVCIRYRADETSEPSINPHVRNAMRIIAEYLDDKDSHISFTLRPRQVLITDNSKTLHARTAFVESEPRKMHRLFFDGKASSGEHIEPGFLP